MNQALKETLSFLFVLLFVLSTSGGYVFYRQSGRPGAAQLTEAKRLLATAKAKLDDSTRAKPLTPMARNWTKFTTMTQAFGLDVNTEKDGVLRTEDGGEVAYTGASNAWTATVTGDPASVMGFVRACSVQIPLVLNGVSVAPGDYTPGKPATGNRMSANVSVLGSL